MAGKGTKGTRKAKGAYGIGEWFGHNYVRTDHTIRQALLPQAQRPKPQIDCRFRESFQFIAPRITKGVDRGKASLLCNKRGGVCCIRQFRPSPDGTQEYGPLVTTCPVRFTENGEVFKHIARIVLKTENWSLAKEIDFLEPDIAPSEFLPAPQAMMLTQQALNEPSLDLAMDQPAEEQENDEARSVGRIDMVIAGKNQDGSLTRDWCAVELQAVYFSGDSMADDFPAVQQQLEGGPATNLPPVGPTGGRRPDFRSSGPKRLLPQLQIKVPSLRRWGKKMVVVIDASFHSTFGPMRRADDVSNADIIWCIVGYDEGPSGDLAMLKVLGTVMTTLEEAVIGLTAGKPRSKPAFEQTLWGKVGKDTY